MASTTSSTCSCSSSGGRHTGENDDLTSTSAYLVDLAEQQAAAHGIQDFNIQHARGAMRHLAEMCGNKTRAVPHLSTWWT